MNSMWANVAQPLVAGMGGMLGVYLVEEGLRALDRRGLVPARWRNNR